MIEDVVTNCFCASLLGQSSLKKFYSLKKIKKHSFLFFNK